MTISLVCWIVLGICAGCGLILLGVLTFIMLVSQRFRLAVRLAVATVLCLAIALAAFGMVTGTLVSRAGRKLSAVSNEVRQTWQRRQEQIARLKAMTPPDLRAKAPEAFFTFTGCWDWYRIPLVFPYSLEAIDTLDRDACLLRYIGGRVEDPNTSSVSLPLRITRYAFDRRYLLFRGETDGEWGIFTFASEQTRIFSSRPEMEHAASQSGFSGEMGLQSIEEGYDHYYTPD